MTEEMELSKEQCELYSNYESFISELSLDDLKKEREYWRSVHDDLCSRIKTTNNMLGIFLDNPAMEHLLDMHLENSRSSAFYKAVAESNLKMIDNRINEIEKSIA